MATHKQALVRSTALGTVLQLAMVIVGHFVTGVALMFGPLGMGISLVTGAVYGRAAGAARRWQGGALAGGLCALIGIAVSYGLGDVTAVILAFGTLSSAAAGILGAWAVAQVKGRTSVISRP